MIQRGGFSFVAMLVINPIVILFYQNCSMAPVSNASNLAQTPITIQQSRSISSEKGTIAKPLPAACINGQEACPTSNVE